MRVPRSYIGKMVIVLWRDPFTAMISCQPEQVPKGTAGLAVRKEKGTIEDITEGVVLISHSEGRSPLMPDQSRSNVDYQLTWVQEALVEEIQVFDPQQAVRTEQEPTQ